MFLGHFGPKKYPDLVKSWIDLGKKEFTQTYHTGPIDRGRVTKEISKNEENCKKKKIRAFYSLALSGY